jgi:hypothetical protein
MRIMDRASIANGGGEYECIKDSGWKVRKRPLGRRRRRWENNIKMDLTEIEWNGMDSIGLSQDRDQWRALVNTIMNLWVP